jgi:hypothetical protein
MKDNLQKKLKQEGRSLRWFHKKYISAITYNALALQLNGYAVICDEAKKAVDKYLKE